MKHIFFSLLIVTVLYTGCATVPIAPPVNVAAEKCEANGGFWTWNGNVNQWQCADESSHSKFQKARKNCLAGDNEACCLVGEYYSSVEYLNIDMAYKYLETSCENGSNNACGKLSTLYLSGLSRQGEPRNYFKAFELANKACAGGISKSCYDVGFMYESGFGTRLDLANASNFYGKACDMKNADGCEKYKQLKSPQPIQQVITNNQNIYQQEQNSNNAISQFAQDMADLNKRQEEYNQQYQLNRQLKQINNNLRGIRYGY